MDALLGIFGTDSFATFVAYALSLLFAGSLAIFHKGIRYLPIICRVLSVGTVARDFFKTLVNAYKDKTCTPEEAKQILAKGEKFLKAVINFGAAGVPDEVTQ